MRPLEGPYLKDHGTELLITLITKSHDPPSIFSTPARAKPEVSLASARARDSEILEKLGKVQQAIQHIFLWLLYPKPMAVWPGTQTVARIAVRG